MTNEDILHASRSRYCIGYHELLIEADVSQVSRYCDTTRRLFTPIAKAITPEDNSRWLLRHYLAIKVATAAALFAGSAAFAYERNLLMGVPYFSYYALLSASRAYLLTSPQRSSIMPSEVMTCSGLTVRQPRRSFPKRSLSKGSTS